MGADRPTPDRSETHQLGIPLALREANEKLVLETLRTQDRLEAAEAFRLLVEAVEDYSVFMVDPEGRVATWNTGAARMYGYGPEAIVGHPLSIFCVKDDAASGSTERELTGAREARRHQAEGVRVRQDGSTFWANVIIASLSDDEGRPMGFAVATQDMTERLRSEQERVRLMRAEENVRRKDEFFAIMGHELRNPLAPMVTALQLIKLRGGQENSRELAILERQIKHMTRLIDDLLDVSRAMREQVHFSPSVVEIAAVLADAVEGASPLIGAKGHKLTVDVPAEGLPVHADPERLAQVFGNLLTNAAKYMDDGGSISVQAIAHKREIEVTVSDTGVGIPAELMPRIFELFTQGDQGIERRLGGLGIGLAIARRFVNEHGGEITATSEGLGRGSRFTVRLPRARAATLYESAPPPPSGSRRTVSPKRILVVDDNEDFCATFGDVLRALGHETRIAFEGQRALEIAPEFQPQIVFLDIGLPGIDGFQVARRMRQLPACMNIPIVAVTGYALESDREKALNAGFSDHVPKPITREVLERAIATATT